MNVFELFAVLTLNKDDYEKNLDSAETKSNSWANKIQDLMGNKTVATFTLVANSVLKVIQKINQLMMATIDYADAIGDLAAKYDMTAESVSELQYVASQTGTTVETVAASMSTLYMKAKSNGDAFKELGVSVTDTNGNFKSMDDLFFETIGALNSLEDEGAKSSYMLDMFGRSAMNNGELLRMTTEDIEAMRKTAQDLGITVSQSTADFAGGIKDKLDEIKLQGQSALAALVTGEDGAEEKIQKWLDNVMSLLETYIPAFANFAVRLVIQAAVGIIRVAPKLVQELVTVVLDVLLDVEMWIQVGIDIGKALLEGFINGFVRGANRILRFIGIEIPEVDFGASKDLFSDSDISTEYEISERVQQDITVKVEASGDTAVSKESAEKTAEALAPYIDKILGGK